MAKLLLAAWSWALLLLGYSSISSSRMVAAHPFKEQYPYSTVNSRNPNQHVFVLDLVFLRCNWNDCVWPETGKKEDHHVGMCDSLHWTHVSSLNCSIELDRPIARHGNVLTTGAVSRLRLRFPLILKAF